jgi:hypothetical protein
MQNVYKMGVWFNSLVENRAIICSIIAIPDAVAIHVEISINNHTPISTGLAGFNPVAMTIFG